MSECLLDFWFYCVGIIIFSGICLFALILIGEFIYWRVCEFRTKREIWRKGLQLYADWKDKELGRK